MQAPPSQADANSKTEKVSAKVSFFCRPTPHYLQKRADFERRNLQGAECQMLSFRGEGQETEKRQIPAHRLAEIESAWIGQDGALRPSRSFIFAKIGQRNERQRNGKKNAVLFLGQVQSIL